MAIAEIKWKLVKDTYFFDTTTCYLSEDGNHLFYSGNEKRIEILINDLNELVRKGCAMWLELGEYKFGLDRLSKCPTTTWYSINQKLYSLEPWGVMKESKKSARKSLEESNDFYFEVVFYKDVAKAKEYIKEIYNKFLKKYGYSKNDITWKLTSKGIGFLSSSENIGFDLEDYILDHMYEYGDYEFETDYELIESKKSAKKSLKENKLDFSVYDFIDYMIKMKCIDGIMDNISFSITQEDFNYALNDLGYDFKIIKRENPHDSINGVRYYIYQYQIDDEIYRVWIDEKWFVLDACLKY